MCVIGHLTGNGQPPRGIWGTVVRQDHFQDRKGVMFFRALLQVVIYLKFIWLVFKSKINSSVSVP